MTDVNELHAYMEWRQANEGLERDVSPEAFALQVQITELLSIIGNIAEVYQDSVSRSIPWSGFEPVMELAWDIQMKRGDNA